MSYEGLLAEFEGSVCPACHHRAHDPGSCSECPRCELHTDEALAFVLRYEPELLVAERLGFDDLLTIGEALLEHYPPDTIVCSHSVKADVGARTVAGIADLIASCRDAAGVSA